MATAAVNTAVKTIELFGSSYDEAARADIAALEARTITAAGLATGGGNLSADRVITVLKASAAEATAGAADDRAVTPLALAGPLNTIRADVVLRAPLASPVFTGVPQAPQQPLGTADDSIATTAFVAAAVEGGGTGTVAEQLADHLADTTNPHLVDKADVGLGDVANLAPAALPVSDATQIELNLKAPLESPEFTGVPKTVLPPYGDNSPQIASTAFVAEVAGDLTELIVVKAPLNSPVLTGVPEAPQAVLGTATPQIATTAFVAAAVADNDSTLAAHLVNTSNPHQVDKADVGLALVANLAPADLPVSNATQTAINELSALVAAKAPLASPQFTGIPIAPPAPLGTATAQIATTSFVAAAVDAVAGDDSALAAHLADTANPHQVDKTDVGLALVANLAPADLPVSNATQIAINIATGAANAAQADIDGHQANLSNPHAVTKAQVGLGLVANLAPADLPVSNATQAAINASAVDISGITADLAAHKANTANPHAVDKADVGLGNVANLAPADLPVSDQTQIALNLKANSASPIFSGIPTVPLAQPGTETAQIASTAFVAAAIDTAGDVSQATADEAVAAALAAQATADSAVATAEEALGYTEALPDLVGRRHERPGDSDELFGLDASGEPMTIAAVDPAWTLITAAGRVLRVTANAAYDPRFIAPRGIFPVEAGQGWLVRFKVQRQVDPGDPLNDSVSLRVRWLNNNKALISESTVDNIALVIANGIQERRAFLATGTAFPPPAGAVYFRPYVALYGGAHVTDIIVIEARQTAAVAGPLYLPVLDANPVAAPGVGRMALYAFRNPDGTATLRVQGGTSTTALDVIVNVGAGT